MTTKRGAIYCRISLNDPKVPKVENQEAMCRDLARANGIEVGDRVYVDDGISGSYFLDRPGWGDLLRDAEAGEFDVLLAQTEARFSRQVMEKETLMLTCAARGITWLTINNGATDPATADGQFFGTMRAALDRMEARRKGELQRQAAERRRLSGEPELGGDRRPFGYEEDKKTLRESEAELLRVAYAGIIDGSLTPTKIKYAWNKAGLRTSRDRAWTTESVRALLLRARNARIRTYTPELVVGGKKRKGRTELVRDANGDQVRGNWEEIVDEETFLAAARVLADRRGLGTREHAPRHLCSGLVTCASCGTKVEANSNKRGVKYRCRVHAGADPVRRVEGAKHIEILSSTVDEVVTSAVVAALTYSPTSAVSEPDTVRVGAARARIRDIDRGIARLMELVEDETFSASEVRAKKTKLVAEREALEGEVASILGTNARAVLLADVQALAQGRTPLTDLAKARTEIRERFANMPLDQRRALVQSMLRVEVAAGGRGPERVKVTHLVATGLNEGASVLWAPEELNLPEKSQGATAEQTAELDAFVAAHPVREG